jgi:hypothetical protein
MRAVSFVARIRGGNCVPALLHLRHNAGLAPVPSSTMINGKRRATAVRLAYLLSN